ncbi:hypothetical protein E2562_018195 [Oryza meyeriana var. granulata]|uniref:Uncharacterized protein n=1 Tax=Oryza meyeriana var. granulata TaxID=110450 RepID=A0A6G1C7F3_9ORYZ|nr:hypothetical protein E2562_018195 [Oryza meyeriana var. granulata]
MAMLEETEATKGRKALGRGFIYLTPNNMQLPLQPKGDPNILPWFHCGKGAKGQQPTMLPEDLRIFVDSLWLLVENYSGANYVWP